MGLCAPGVTHSTWNAIDFGDEMSRCVHTMIYMVYVLYITCICSKYSLYIHILSCLSVCSLQDCLAAIPPHSFYIGERGDEYDVAELLFDHDSMWFVRPQLFFHCTMRPIGTAAAASTVPTRTFH